MTVTDTYTHTQHDYNITTSNWGTEEKEKLNEPHGRIENLWSSLDTVCANAWIITKWMAIKIPCIVWNLQYIIIIIIIITYMNEYDYYSDDE